MELNLEVFGAGLSFRRGGAGQRSPRVGQFRRTKGTNSCIDIDVRCRQNYKASRREDGRSMGRDNDKH